MNLRHRPASPPRWHAAARVDLAGRALQALEIVDLALEDDGGAVSSLETPPRDALRPLGAAARRALVAACSPEVWPPA